MGDFGADADAQGEDDGLPWLEAVDEEEERTGPSALKMIVAVVIGLAAIGLVISGVFWLRDRDEGGGKPELIAAPKGDYKAKPENPGGMQVEGTGETAFAASEGAEPNGRINIDAVPETPVNELPKAAPPPAPSPAPPRAPAQSKAPAPPAGQSAAGGASIQLGAFSSPAAATGAWKALAGRFKYLDGLSYSVTPVTTGGKTLYRLRASGPDAAALCGRLRIAGESCVTIG